MYDTVIDSLDIPTAITTLKIGTFGEVVGIPLEHSGFILGRAEGTTVMGGKKRLDSGNTITVNEAYKSNPKFCDCKIEATKVFQIEKSFNKFTIKNEEEGNVAFIECGPGEISNVEVKQEFRKCGFATKLTSMCLNEKWNSVSQGKTSGVPTNDAEAQLRTFDEKYRDEMIFTQLKRSKLEECEKLVYLQFDGKLGEQFSLDGANVLFNAVIESGYEKMLIIKLEEFEQGIADPKLGFGIVKRGETKFQDLDAGAYWFFCKPHRRNEVAMEGDTVVLPHMDVETPIDFKINRENHENCLYEDDTFTVIKTNEEKNSFFALDGPGYIDCKNGEISLVGVDKSAERCGLMVLLTRLCLMDKDMNGQEGNVKPPLALQNIALREIKQVSVDEYNWVKENCKNLWYLFNVADPTGAVKGYLKAGILEGYNKIIVYEWQYDKRPKHLIGGASTQYYKDAEMEDGHITVDGEQIILNGAYLFFCQENSVSRRRYKMDIATIPTMYVGDGIDYEINAEKRPDCKYIETEDSFYIQKTRNKGGIQFDVFEVGFILCHNGYLITIDVVSQGKYVAECGLEIHLIRLCFSDINLNINILGEDGDTAEKKNEGIKYFRTTIKDSIYWEYPFKQREVWIKDNCVNFWAIQTIAYDDLDLSKPSWYGNILFEAAVYAGFGKMIIADYENNVLHPINENRGAESTSVWQDRFDTFGNINDERDGTWSNYNTDWYFCKQGVI